MKKLLRSSRRKNGFTLVEIMIVVAILGLLAAIAVPSFVRAKRIHELREMGLLPPDTQNISNEQLDILWKATHGEATSQTANPRPPPIGEQNRFTITSYANGVEVIRDNNTGMEYLGRGYGSVGYGIVLMPKTNPILEKP